VLHEEWVEMRHRSESAKSERKFFPFWILFWSRWKMNEASLALWSRDTTRVLGFLGGTADKRRRITDKRAEYQSCAVLADGTDKPKPKTCSSRVKWFEVTDGPVCRFHRCG